MTALKYSAPVAFLLVLIATDMRALDCARATSGAEKAICADPDAIKADDRMVAAYSALKAKLAGPEATALLATQKSWLNERNFTCADNDPPKKGCLAEFTNARATFLEGSAEGGDYPVGAFRAALQSRKPKKKGDWNIAVGLLKVADPKTPADRAFDAAVDKLLAETPLKEKADPDASGDELSYDASMRVTWASKDLIAAETSISRYDGGAHGMSATSHITIDGRTGKQVAFGQIFDDAGRKKALASCEGQIKDQRKEKDAVQPNGSASAEGFTPVGEAFGEIGSWSFGPGETTVTFDPYEIGSYAEGAYSCSFRNSELKAWVKPDFPLPQ